MAQTPTNLNHGARRLTLLNEMSKFINVSLYNYIYDGGSVTVTHVPVKRRAQRPALHARR